jgi:hypothetical protein
LVFAVAVIAESLVFAGFDGVGQAMGTGDSGVIALDAEFFSFMAELVGELSGDRFVGDLGGVLVLDGGAGH